MNTIDFSYGGTVHPSFDDGAFNAATPAVAPIISVPSPPRPAPFRRGMLMWTGAALLLLAVLAGTWALHSARGASPVDTAPLTAPVTLRGLAMLTDPLAAQSIGSIQSSYAQQHPGHAVQPAFYGSRPFTVNLMIYRGDLSGFGDPKLAHTSEPVTGDIRCGLAFGKFADCWRTSTRLSVSVLTMDSPDLQRAAAMVAQAWQAIRTNTQAH